MFICQRSANESIGCTEIAEIAYVTQLIAHITSNWHNHIWFYRRSKNKM